MEVIDRRLRVSQAIRKAVFDLESLTVPGPDEASAAGWNDSSIWTRNFDTPKGENIYLRMLKRPGGGTWDVEFQGKEGYDPSDSDEQWYVLNMVLRLIKQFIEEMDPQAIRFRGWTEKQHKLYGKMLKRFFPNRPVSEDGGHYILHAPKEQEWG